MTKPQEDACAAGTGAALQLSLDLKRNAQAPGVARAVVAQRCEEIELDRSISQSLVLLVSEVVTNAVRHSTGPPEAPIELRGALTEETIRITVTDAGEGFIPQQRDPGRTHDGYGLYLLEKVADRWGVESGAETTVWFELPRGS